MPAGEIIISPRQIPFRNFVPCVGEQQTWALFEIIISPDHVLCYVPRIWDIFGKYFVFWKFGVYESIATVGESRVWWRADFQSGSRVLKKVF